MLQSFDALRFATCVNDRLACSGQELRNSFLISWARPAGWDILGQRFGQRELALRLRHGGEDDAGIVGGHSHFLIISGRLAVARVRGCVAPSISSYAPVYQLVLATGGTLTRHAPRCGRAWTGRDRRGSVSLPYRDGASAYLEAGWKGIVPLPPRRKSPPPDGFTGRLGVDPATEQVEKWIAGEEGEGNLGLRLPPDVVGIDVDVRGGGLETRARLEERWGALPPTIVSTSRTDGSGILLYRVPSRATWHDPGAGIQIVHHGWRYAVVAPSIHPDTGRPYGWWDQPGERWL
ncbi:MAG: hypothetical protein GEU78_16230, partial [Actinobacteria bacterium]|nr:hypothetical protein [Actinomycetota bacterium]